MRQNYLTKMYEGWDGSGGSTTNQPGGSGHKGVWVKAMTEIDKARFWSKCKPTRYCWEWQAHKDSCGYGFFKIQGEEVKASRIAYQIINGEIDSSLHVLHRCDNPGCINPDHLFTGTHQDNMLDKQRKGRGKVLGSASKYHGVAYRRDSKNWRAQFSYKGKHYSFGSYKTELEAAKARDKGVIQHKVDLPLNFNKNEMD